MRSATELLLLLLLFSAFLEALALSVNSCTNRPIHATYEGHGYMFSWVQPQTARLELNWHEAREFCRARCMDLVSLETKEENEFVKGIMNSVPGEAKNVWTSGRKCTFAGCDRADLMPADIYGWLWAGSQTRIPPTTNRLDSDWSDLGRLGVPQPDNFEKQQGGRDEDCLAFMKYSEEEGFKWHDVACYIRGPFICEDNLKLLEQYGINNPFLVALVQPTTTAPVPETTTPTTDTTDRIKPPMWGEQEQPAPHHNPAYNPYREGVNDKF